MLDYLHENRESSLLVIEYVWEGYSEWQTNFEVSKNVAFEMRSETVTVCLSAMLLNLCLHYLYENRES